MKIPKQDLIDEAIRMKEVLNRIPTTKDCCEIGKYSFNTYNRTFGSWLRMTKEIFNDNRVMDYTKYYVSCEFCSEKIEKTKCQLSKHNFCSSSCAAKYNNKAHPKRERTWKCSKCSEPIKGGKKYCKECFPQRNHLEDMTLDQYMKMYGDQGCNKFNILRQSARKTMNKSDPSKCCFNCKYSKHTEVCHIKSIKDFERDAMISEINHVDNLIRLCRNCHWELDHGFADWITKKMVDGEGLEPPTAT